MIYLFICDKDDRGCGHSFEIECLMSAISTLKAQCPKCYKTKTVRRDYSGENKIVFDSSPKTLGALADRQTERFSEDKKASLNKKHNEYKDKAFTGSLPDGASLKTVDKNGRRIASRTQRGFDPRKK